jgi:hypothetical protein
MDEIHGLPPNRDIYFSIDLVLVVAHVSNTPCRMSIPKLVELKNVVARDDTERV